MKTLLKNAKIVLEKKIESGALIIDNGKIAAITAKAPKAAPGDTIIDCKGKYLLPGFFETHMHGINLYDAMRGRDDLGEDASKMEYDDAISHIMASLPKTGVTSSLLSSYATPRDILDRFLREAKKYRAGNHPGHARLLGLDLEGNFLKDPKFSGAQDPDSVLKPSVPLFKELQETSGGLIRKALIAPEWGDTACELIRYMAKEGLAPTVGHTGCTRDELLRAHACGLRAVVHTGNGPMSQNFKSGGALDGIFELGPRLYGEIICDCKHVHPRWINTLINCFSMERVLGVSDAVQYAGAGLKDGTVVRGCVIRDNALWVAGKANTLAGSISPLNLQFNNVINLFTSDRKAYFELKTPAPDKLDAALVKACRMYSLNPAEMLGEDGEIGSLKKGKRADLILADISGKPGNFRFRIEKVLIAGAQAA